MKFSMKLAIQQLYYFFQDIDKNLGRNKMRIIFFVVNPVFWGLFKYRFDRFLSLLFGKFYVVIRLVFFPLFLVLEVYSRMDIHYRAHILGGLRVLHTSGGIVISGDSIIGKNLILTGGNIIGRKIEGPILIGDNCSLGANATIIGPLKLGNGIKIGANACVVKDCLSDGVILVGVPAKPLSKSIFLDDSLNTF